MQTEFEKKKNPGVFISATVSWYFAEAAKVQHIYVERVRISSCYINIHSVRICLCNSYRLFANELQSVYRFSVWNLKTTHV